MVYGYEESSDPVETNFRYFNERLTFLTKNIMSGSPKCSDDSKTKTSELYTLNLIYSMGLKSYVNIFGLVG